MYNIMTCPFDWIDRFEEVDNVAILILSSRKVEKKITDPYYSVCHISLENDPELDDSAVFTDKVALNIADYIKQLPNDLEALLIFGDREDALNPAVEAALRRYKGMDEMWAWRNPHRHPDVSVYTKMCRVLGLDEVEDNIDSKVEVNKNANQNLIKHKENNKQLLKTMKKHPPIIYLPYCSIGEGQGLRNKEFISKIANILSEE